MEKANDMKTTRRRFLQTAAAASIAVPTIIPKSALGDDANAPASERVTLGHIAVGGRGTAVMRGFRSCRNAQSVAVADCFKDRVDHRAQLIGGKGYQDFRDLLARKDIDAVAICSPDHWHVPLAVAAAKAGKDAYVEKPLGMSIEQNQICRKAFRDNERMFQYGTQQRSSRHCHFGCELVRRGLIGEVHTIEVIAPNGGKGGSTAEAPLPQGLDYEMWLGPAPVSPYTSDRCKPPGTYWIYDQSIGYLAGWGAHPLDIMVWGSDADLSGNVEIEGTGMIPTEGLYDCVYNWDMKGKFGKVNFTFKPGGDSTKFIGTDGWVQVRRGGIDAEPKSLLQTKLDGDMKLVKSGNHAQNFVDSVISREDPVSNIEDAVRSDVISHLCDIAVRLDRKVTWDPKEEKILGDDEATKLLKRPMREPWTL